MSELIQKMRAENRPRSLKFSDQNQAPRDENTKPKSWGAQIVKGFTADKKTSTLQINKKNPPAPAPLRAVKRSLIGDLASSTVTAATHRRQSSGSRDLFIELDHLRDLVQESKERELKLQAQLSECKNDSKISDLLERIRLLESENLSLSQQLNSKRVENGGLKDLELQVAELSRLNKELQLQKRNLACKLSSVESQLASLSKANQSDIIAKVKAEALMLRHTNEDLCKQVEDLQMNRLNEVEELAYLRWVNSCLRDELQNSSPCQRSNDESADSTNSETNRRSNDGCVEKIWVHLEEEEYTSPSRRHSISGGSKCFVEDLASNKRRQSDGFVIHIKETDKEAVSLVAQNYSVVQRSELFGNSQENNKLISCLDVEKRALRVPNPPPRPSCSVSSGCKEPSSAPTPNIAPPPPPPPPPPPKLSAKNGTQVQRAPQVVEFYHSLMKRDTKKDSTNAGICDAPDVANVRSSMIGEIENRSSHLLAIKADVETQAEFVNSLIREVNGAVYRDIEDVVAFVKWLDDELCYLVDERAVLKHFDWPERKADTLREAAFGYQDLKKLESEVSHYKDDLRITCDIALKKMVAFSEKMERTVYSLVRTRESLMCYCKKFQIPTEWMLDQGIISKIKVGSIKLAKIYMKRVATELQLKAAFEKDPSMDYMLLQGVRFAFRIHQFAGGFDAETMHAFEELRNLADRKSVV